MAEAPRSTLPLYSGYPHQRDNGGDLQFRATKCFSQHVEVVVVVSTELTATSLTRTPPTEEDVRISGLVGTCSHIIYTRALCDAMVRRDKLG